MGLNIKFITASILVYIYKLCPHMLKLEVVLVSPPIDSFVIFTSYEIN